MTKRLIVLIFTLSLIFNFLGIENNLAYAKETAFTNVNYVKTKDIRVITDNGEIKFDVSPQIVDDRTLVPMRAIFEELGLKVTWNKKTETATGTNENTSISFKIGSKKVNIDGKEKKIDVSANIIGNRTMIPLRFLSENMGYNVLWVQESNLILMSEDEIVEEWKYEGYEKVLPHKKYERKYINGIKTPITRYTGEYAEIEDKDEEINDGKGIPQGSAEQTKPEQNEIPSRSGGIRGSKDIIRIYLSPSNQPANLYITGDTTEKAEMEAIAAKVKEILDSEYNCETVMATIELSIDSNGRPLEAKDKGCDVYVALHSNAGGGPNASGAVGFYHPDYDEGKLLASNIVAELQNICPIPSNRSDSVVNGMDEFGGIGLAEIRNPSKYGLTAVLIETNFHDNVDISNWIVNNKDEIARAYVNGIVKTFNISEK